MSYKPLQFDRIKLDLGSDENGFFVADKSKILFLFKDNQLHYGIGNARYNAYCTNHKEAVERLNNYIKLKVQK